jgi:hypothetical protein
VTLQQGERAAPYAVRIGRARVADLNIGKGDLVTADSALMLISAGSIFELDAGVLVAERRDIFAALMELRPDNK